MLASFLAASTLFSSASLAAPSALQYNPASSFTVGNVPFRPGWIVYTVTDVVDMKITYREDTRREDADLVFYRKAHSLWPTGDRNPGKLTWISSSGSEYKAGVWSDSYSNHRESRAKFLPQAETEKVERGILSTPSYRKATFTYNPLLAGHILEINEWEPGMPPELTFHPYYTKQATSQGDKPILRLHDFKNALAEDGSVPLPLPAALRYQSQITIEIIKRYPRPKTVDIKVGTGQNLGQFAWADIELVRINETGGITGEVESQRLSPLDMASVNVNPDGSIECLAQAIAGMKEGGVRNIAWPDGTYQQARLIKVYPKDKWVDRFDG